MRFGWLHLKLPGNNMFEMFLCLAAMTSLFAACMQVLQENIDGLWISLNQLT